MHSTVQQCHRVVDVISSCFERKRYCSAVFLDVAQAFERVRHAGLLWKLKTNLPSIYNLIMKSYLTDRFHRISYGAACSSLLPVRASVTQGSVLGPFLYTADVPQHPSTTFCSFADDMAILSTNETPHAASDNL
jgi:hypothetical protein